MNTELLKLGAETLGWEWRPGSPWSSNPAYGDHIYIPGYQTISAHAYWLPAYMAEALVQHANLGYTADTVLYSREAEPQLRVFCWGDTYRSGFHLISDCVRYAPLLIAASLVELERIKLERAWELVK